MNILSYIHVHRLPNPSGVGRVIDQILTTHAALFPGTCHRMLVAGNQYDKVYEELSDFWKMARFIPHASSNTLQQARWAWFNTPKAEDYWDNVDVVYCPAESYVSTRRAPLVCTIHDVAGFEDDLYPDSHARKWHCRKWRILFRQIAQHAQAVVTVSEFSASRIAHHFPDLEGKLRVIYNAPHDIFSSEPAPEVARGARELTGGFPYVLVPGGLSLRKNADLLLEAIPLLRKQEPGLKVVVAGSNDAQYRARLMEMGCDNTMLLGYVSDELLNALYQGAEVVWFPSRYEGFGMPAIEAMAAGVPVVASHAASIPEVVGDAAILCGIDDAGGHLEAIASIIENPSLRKDLCARGRSRIQLFTWEASAKRLESTFQALSK